MKMFTGSILRMANGWTREMFHVKHGEKQMQKNKTYSVEPLFSKSSDDFFSPFFSKAALTADFGQNLPGFGQSA